MSKDPKTSQSPPAAKPVETLEDAVYKPSLTDDNSAVRGTNPLIAVPTAIVTYACVAYLVFIAVTQTEVGKQVLKHTTSIDLTEDSKDKEEEPPPPPPPAPAAPAAPPLKIELKDAPPPPPMTDQETVPETAPKEIPKVDYSTAFAAKPGETYVGAGAIGGTGGGGSGLGNIGGAAHSSSATVHDFSYNDIVEKSRPPLPPYPPMAKAARVEGTVRVELIIGPDGVPVSAKALSGPSMLHAHATSYAMKWRFEPAIMDGHPVSAKFFIDMKFSYR